MPVAMILAFALKHLKLLAIGGAVAVVVFLFMAFKHEQEARQRAETALAAAKVAATVQTAQAGLNSTAAQTVDQAQARAVNITVKADEAAHVVQSAVGAATPLPSGVRDSALSAIDGLRREAAAADGAPDSDSAVPSRPVPAPAG